MSNPSNLYAEKVFAEHPIALWPLDDQLDYVSLISESQRDFSDDTVWTISGGTVIEDILINSPFDNSPTCEFQTTGTDIVLFSDRLVDAYLSPRLKTISIGFYAYEDVDLAIQDKVVESFTLSIFSDPDGQPHFSNTLESSSTIQTKSANKWHFYSHTFDLPESETISVDAVTEFVVGVPTNFELSSHGFSDNDRVMLSVDGQLPGGFYEQTIYYVQTVDSNNFNLSLTEDGDPIVATSSGVNTPSVTLIKYFDLQITANLARTASATFYLNGLTAGQWSEEFQESSFGIDLDESPNIGLGLPYYAYPSNSYGLAQSSAYYIANNNELLARNINLPMVYGSRNLTSLVGDSSGRPSIIFPGNGILNQNGQYRTYTIETWLRINANTFKPRRIFGPIASTDGLYIDGPFMILKIGDTTGAHYVGDMYRPMLLNIIIFENGASLVINGEKVLDITYQTSSLSLPSNLSSSGVEQDWVGFYSYDDIEKFEIDCFAIYPYRVPTAVSKRRYVYGQAVDFPENVSAAYNGKSFPVDYTFARHSNNYVYPDIGQWRRGNVENLSLDKNVLAPPNYELPEIVFDNKTSDSWLSTLDRTYSNSITLKPDTSWNNTNGYIYFDSVNLGERDTKAFYGVFEANINYAGTETLFTLENSVNKNYLSAEIHTVDQSIDSVAGTVITSASHSLRQDDIIKFIGTVPAEILANKEYFVKYIDENSFEISENKGEDSISLSSAPESFRAHFIRYRLKYGSASEYTVYQSQAITLGTTFVAGLDLTKFANEYGGNVSTFLKNKTPLRVYFGGNRLFTSTYSGYIYRIGFATKRNLAKLDYLFADNGVPFLRYQFDGGQVAVEAGTEIVDAGSAYQIFIDDILSHKASYTLFVRNDFGKLKLDIATDSSWQDYIPLQYFAKTITNADGKKEYGIGFLQFNVDYPEPQRFDGTNYDAERSWVRTYISFQYVEDGANKIDNEFSAVLPLSRSNVIVPTTGWESTKYEVVNNTIIYPPSGVDFAKLAIVVHADIAVEGILSRPVRIRKLELAAKSLNALLSNRVYSRLGSFISPYVEYGFYQDNDAYNPFSVYKDSTPHLYLTKHSGIRLQGNFPLSRDRGMLLRINPERKDRFSLAAIQLSVYFDSLHFMEQDIEIFQCEGRVARYFFKIRSVDPDNRRAQIYVTDIDGNELNSVGFYINGTRTLNPTFTVGEWNMLGIAFVNPLDINRRSGAFKINGPVMFNNLSYYSLTTIQEGQRNVDEPAYVDYSEADYVGVSPSRIYEFYTGTSKIITGDDLVLAAKEYRYSSYKDLSVQTATIKPA